MPRKRQATESPSKARKAFKAEAAEWREELGAEAASNRVQVDLITMSAWSGRLRSTQAEVYVVSYFDSVRNARGPQSCRVSMHMKDAFPDLWRVRFVCVFASYFYNPLFFVERIKVRRIQGDERGRAA